MHGYKKKISKEEKYFCNQLKDSLNNANIYNLAGSLEILEIFVSINFSNSLT